MIHEECALVCKFFEVENILFIYPHFQLSIVDLEVLVDPVVSASLPLSPFASHVALCQPCS